MATILLAEAIKDFFTFQSGYIQIIISNKSPFGILNLYIPIWLYSNVLMSKRSKFIYFLYIPIWLYSNVYHNNTSSVMFAFTFQSGYIHVYNLKYPLFLYIPIWLYSNKRVK